MRADRVLIRADASLGIGMGHIVRCCNLADVIHGAGVQVIFVTAVQTTAERYVRERGFEVRTINCAGPEDDAVQTANIARMLNAPDLIVDHYSLDASWERRMRGAVARIIVLDDLADRRHDCDVLIDGALGQEGGRYDGLIPDECRKLLGGGYSILNAGFLNARRELSSYPRDAHKIHVFFGGADPDNYTGRYAGLIAGHFTDVKLLIVTGALFSDSDSIEKLQAAYPDRIEWRHNVSDMARTMLPCTMAVGAPGITTWERACMGLASAYLAVSKNQIPILANLERERFSLYLGEAASVNEAEFVKRLRLFLDDAESRREFAAKGMAGIDGKGTLRILDALYPGRAKMSAGTQAKVPQC